MSVEDDFHTGRILPLAAASDRRSQGGHWHGRILFQEADRPVDRFPGDLRLVPLDIDHDVHIVSPPCDFGNPVGPARGCRIGHLDFTAEGPHFVEYFCASQATQTPIGRVARRADS